MGLLKGHTGPSSAASVTIAETGAPAKLVPEENTLRKVHVQETVGASLAATPAKWLLKVV